MTSRNNSEHSHQSFRETVRGFYRENKRSFPWRDTENPYYILISEIMLQQTQVSRVVPKYLSFVSRFPTPSDLASAPLREVLEEWRGLGYNRRGVNLKRAAELISSQYNEVVPVEREVLLRLPGVGHYTARAVRTFAWNKPEVFIETNIRTAFLHHFFQDSTEVHDNEIMPLIEKSLDHRNPREWYWALMDYGSYLKQILPNPSRKSKHHTKQSPFKGSRREARAQILHAIVRHQPLPYSQILEDTRIDEKWNVQEILEELEKEGFIKKTKNGYSVQ